MSRKQPGAMIHDPEAAAARVVRMVQNGAIETLSGKSLPTPVDSICLHSDSPTALLIAERVRTALEAAGVAVKAFA